MLIEWFLSIKSLPNLLFGVLCLPGDQSHPFAQPTINLLACCICWAGLLGRAVFPLWNEGPNFGSYSMVSVKSHRNESHLTRRLGLTWPKWLFNTCLKFSRQFVLTINKESHFGIQGKNIIGDLKCTLKGKHDTENPFLASENVKVLSSDAPWISLNYYKMRKFLLLDNLCGKLNFLKHSKATELPVNSKYLLVFLFLKKM